MRAIRSKHRAEDGARGEGPLRLLDPLPPEGRTDVAHRPPAADGGATGRADREGDQRVHQVAHDLKDPLHVVEGHLEIAIGKLDRHDSKDLREGLAFALDNTQRALQMVASLLEHAHVGANGGPVERVDLEALIDEVISNQRARIDQTQARITHGALPSVHGHREQLVQVFENLIGNAIKYRGDQPPRIHITHERVANGEALISVRDEGIGVPADETDTIFEMFSRGHHGEDREGTGMGLALCERIIERHGGRIWVESTPAQGATFHLTLPNHPSKGEAHMTPDRELTERSSSLKGSNPAIVDRNNTPIGTTSNPGLEPGEGPLEIEIADTLHEMLDLEDQHVKVPRSLVAGIRRDEIRLSVSLDDPLLGSRLRAGR